MLYIGEEVGTGDGPGSRHRARSARRHDDLRQEPAELARRHRHRRRRAACSMRRTSTWTRSPSGPAIRTGVDRHRRVAGRQHPARRQGEGRAGRPRSPPASSTGRAMPQLIEAVRDDRRRDPADRRRRRRRRHPHDRSGRDRHRHLSRHRRRAGGRARRRGAALHRRPDAGPAACSTREEKVARAAQMGIADPNRIYTHRGHGARRRAVRGDRRDRRQHADRRAFTANDITTAYHRHALLVAHRPRDQGAPPGPGQVLTARASA